MPDRNTFFRYFIGYLLGFTVFLVIIPTGLYQISRFDVAFNRSLIHSPLIRCLISFPVLFLGFFFMMWSNIFLFVIGKGGPAEGFGISISPPTRNLVTSGPYKYTRNPMVFGAFCIYLSAVIFFNSLLALLTLLVFFGLGLFYLKFSEEKRLLKDFGDPYRKYRNAVPMIFPVKWLKK